jgi:bacterioferritin-associated ferredoxin
MIVCHCQRVSDRRVVGCIAAGCSSLRQLADETGAGSGCGMCVQNLRRLLGEHPSDAHGPGSGLGRNPEPANAAS